jgi:hypothetical protein
MDQVDLNSPEEVSVKQFLEKQMELKARAVIICLVTADNKQIIAVDGNTEAVHSSYFKIGAKLQNMETMKDVEARMLELEDMIESIVEDDENKDNGIVN